MPIVTLRDLYLAELHDLFDAEQQILQELPGMAARATSAELRGALEDHYEQTRIHLERLELLFRQLNERPRLDPCEAMRGLISEAHRVAAKAERGDVLDAALIGAAQRIEHYEIAAYGCARSYARTLGDAEATRILQQTLDEEKHADRRLTEIAERGINRSAGEDLVPRATPDKSRLRYVAASELPDFRYPAYRIVTSDGDDVGTVDGFVVNGDSGRPIYYVIDSGGWFTGRRYLLPIAQLELDAGDERFRTPLTREQLRRYPEFSPSAFVAMTDEEAARYERRMLDAVLPYRVPPRHAAEPPLYADLPIYQPPAWLMIPPAPMAPSPWSTQPSVSERRHAPHDDRTEQEHQADMEGQNELMVARGAPDRRSDEAQRQAGDSKRIEKYRER